MVEVDFELPANEPSLAKLRSLVLGSYFNLVGRQGFVPAPGHLFIRRNLRRNPK